MENGKVDEAIASYATPRSEIPAETKSRRKKINEKNKTETMGEGHTKLMAYDNDI